MLISQTIAFHLAQTTGASDTVCSLPEVRSDETYLAEAKSSILGKGGVCEHFLFSQVGGSIIRHHAPRARAAEHPCSS